MVGGATMGTEGERFLTAFGMTTLGQGRRKAGPSPRDTIRGAKGRSAFPSRLRASGMTTLGQGRRKAGPSPRDTIRGAKRRSAFPSRLRASGMTTLGQGGEKADPSPRDTIRGAKSALRSLRGSGRAPFPSRLRASGMTAFEGRKTARGGAGLARGRREEEGEKIRLGCGGGA